MIGTGTYPDLLRFRRVRKGNEHISSTERRTGGIVASATACGNLATQRFNDNIRFIYSCVIPSPPWTPFSPSPSPRSLSFSFSSCPYAPSSTSWTSSFVPFDLIPCYPLNRLNAISSATHRWSRSENGYPRNSCDFSCGGGDLCFGNDLCSASFCQQPRQSADVRPPSFHSCVRLLPQRRSSLRIQ